MDTIRKITQWYVVVIVCVIFAICATIYFKAIAGLDKPAGLVEAFEFMFTSPKEYVMCLLCGGLAKACFVTMIIVAVASVGYIIKSIYMYKVECDEIDLKSI